LKPLLISFSGIDGAGKSTQIEKLRRDLKCQGISVHQLRFWHDVAVLSRFRAGFSRRVFASDGRIGSTERPARRRDKNVQNRALLLARSALYFFDVLSLRWALTKARRDTAAVVVFDRYIYDQLAVLPLRSRWARQYARLLLKIAPRPDLAYLLDAVPEIALARKPEYPLAFMRHYRFSYLKLHEFAELRLIAPGDVDEVHIAILECLKPHITSSSEAEVSTPVIA
jgi:thymidylate kinase